MRSVFSPPQASCRRAGFADVAPQRSEIREDLAKHFTDDGTVGTFVGYKVDDYLVIASDKNRSGEAKLPASTFKIPNSLIALETGVVGDPDKDVFKWDGVTRSIEAWNKDHTMRSAIAASAVPVYQEIARRIGPERMQKYVDLFDYGNRDIGGGIDQFWLTGDLRIDPVQQVDFVDRLRRGVLPVSKRSQDLVRDILPVTKVGDAVIRAKSRPVGRRSRQAVARLDGGMGREGQRATRCSRSISIVAQPRHIADRMAISQACLKRYRRDLVVPRSSSSDTALMLVPRGRSDTNCRFPRVVSDSSAEKFGPIAEASIRPPVGASGNACPRRCGWPRSMSPRSRRRDIARRSSGRNYSSSLAHRRLRRSSAPAAPTS